MKLQEGKHYLDKFGNKLLCRGQADGQTEGVVWMKFEECIKGHEIKLGTMQMYKDDGIWTGFKGNNPMFNIEKEA